MKTAELHRGDEVKITASSLQKMKRSTGWEPTINLAEQLMVTNVVGKVIAKHINGNITAEFGCFRLCLKPEWCEVVVEDCFVFSASTFWEQL